MYLKRIWLENTGPIAHLDVELPFSANGSPKPTVLVGGNGAGKTAALSYVADALIETAKTEYQDVVPSNGINTPYFRIVGGNNAKIGSPHSFAILSFEIKEDNASHQIIYREQVGDKAPENWNETAQNKFGQYIQWNSRNKSIDGVSEQIVKQAFEGKSNCFFPSNRSERPHWYNNTIAKETESFDLGVNFSKQLGSRRIIVTESSIKNQSWLLHLFLDSRADFAPYVTNNQLALKIKGDTNELLISQSGLANVNTVLRDILGDPTVYLATLQRTKGIERICIAKNRQIFIPALQNLSAGQAILFNLFLTIIRYADSADTFSAVSLHQIEGIVIIDEVDAHLHSDLQHDVLPKLIKRFPKIQFILTSHAPLFVLGMEREFGSDGYLLLDMPEGNSISAERFSEFQRSFDYYQKTKTFEDEQRKYLREEFDKHTKPLVLTEGDTDVDYLRTALELHGREDILAAIDVEWIGGMRKGQQFFTGDKSLNNAAEFLRANPEFLKSRRVMLLYDSDTNKPESIEENLWIYTVPFNQKNTLVKKGIENLLPQSLFNPTDRRFYSQVEKPGSYGEVTVVSEFGKRAFCNYICIERRERADFIGFEEVIKALEGFANGNQAL